MPPRNFDDLVADLLTDPASAGELIREYVERSEEDTLEEHKASVFQALQNVANANGIYITRKEEP